MADENNSRGQPSPLEETRREVAALREELGELRKRVDGHGSAINWLKRDNDRQERNHNFLWAYAREEFARAFLWIDAIGGQVLPRAVSFANQVLGRIAKAPNHIVPPHRLKERTRGKTG